MKEPFNTSTPELTSSEVDKCSICGMMELHIHIGYETDEELQEYLDSCGTEVVDYHTGKIKKVIYKKVPLGEGTTSIFDKMLDPILYLICDSEIDLEELENQEDTDT